MSRLPWRFAADGLRHLGSIARGLTTRAGRARLADEVVFLRAAGRCLRHAGPVGLAELLEGSGGAPTAQADLDEVLAVADAVAALHWLSGMRLCLRRATLRYRALRASGADATLVIGVRRAADRRGLRGHAWVEVDGEPFREPSREIGELTVMFVHPAGAHPDATSPAAQPRSVPDPDRRERPTSE